MSRVRVIVIAFVSFLFLQSGAVWACSCFGGKTFEQSVESSSFVLLGRVVAKGQEPDQWEPAYLEIEVIEALKGAPVDRVVRLWDSYAETSCGVGLGTLPPGTLAVFSVEKNSPENSLPELWEETGIRPGPEDYLFGTCSEVWKVFKTENKARRFVRRLLK